LKGFWPSLVLGLSCLVAVHADGQDTPVVDPGSFGKAILDLVAHRATTVSITPAGGDDYDVLWAIWGEDTIAPRAVQLALLRRGPGGARLIWSVRHEGYSPTITSMDGWSFGTRGVILVQFQTGAADSHAEIYGIDAKSMPTMLGMADGALIETRQVDGAAVMEVYQGADLRRAPTCYGWDQDRRRLMKLPCIAAVH